MWWVDVLEGAQEGLALAGPGFGEVADPHLSSGSGRRFPG